jgi:hypothetical protein
MKMKFSLPIFIVSLFCLIIFLSCGDDSGTSPDTQNTFKDTAYIDVQWTENTVIFSESELNSIIEYDSTFENITFDAANEKSNELKVGDVIFIYGKALKKVSSVSISGGHVYVETEYCTLNEAISDGVIHWDKELSYSSDLINNIEVISKHPYTQTKDSNKIEIKFPVGNGMNGKITLFLNSDKLDAECEISKNVGGAEIKYAFGGFVEKIASTGDIKYQGKKLKSFKCENNGVKGEINVSLAATGSTSDLLGGIELPVVLLKMPFIVSGIPCTFNIKMLFVINTKMTTLDASAYIKSKFKFNSNTGITYDGTDVGVIANAGPISMDSNKDSIHVASSAAAGINFGFTFPRFELGIFGETILPYIHTAFLIGGSYTFGTKSCLKIDASYIGAVGYKFDFLGLLSFGGSKNLWQIDKNLKKSGDCD